MICPACGAEKVKGWARGMCRKCYDASHRVKRRALGLCAYCTQPVVVGYVLCAAHRARAQRKEAARSPREREQHMRNRKYWIRLDQWTPDGQAQLLASTSGPHDNPLGWALAWETIEAREREERAA